MVASKKFTGSGALGQGYLVMQYDPKRAFDIVLEHRSTYACARHRARELDAEAVAREGKKAPLHYPCRNWTYQAPPKKRKYTRDTQLQKFYNREYYLKTKHQREAVA